MNGKTEATLIRNGLIVFGIIAFLIMIRALFIVPSWTYDEACEWEYGDEWAHDYSRNVGDTCIKLDYITQDTIDRVDIELSDMREKYCYAPGFWELSKWDSECKKDD